MALSDAERGAVFLAASTSIGVFTGLLPEFSEVRKSVGNPEMTNDVRMAEVAAAALVVGLGLLASSITDSPAPAVASIACAGVLVGVYEVVLQSTPQEKKAATK